MSSVVPWLESWLQRAPAGWSDLHLRLEARPIVKGAGMVLQRIDDAPYVREEDLEALVGHKVDWNRPVDIDRGMTIGGHRFRINTYRAVSGHGVVLRRLGDAPPALDDLGLPAPVLRRKVQVSHGLIVITGETGSGKTTTLASLLAERARQYSTTSITIEDPVEIVHPREIDAADGGVSLFIQREVGHDTQSFASGLRAALREAPDVIAIGEIRDRDSARLALQGAETGHLVFATLHTRSAAETVARLLAFFPVDEHPLVRAQLASGLVLVMRQVLMPVKDRSKRVPAYELMTLDGGVAATIRRGKDEQILNEIRQGGAHGMMALNDMLARLAREGQVSADEALRHSYDTEELQQLL